MCFEINDDDDDENQHSLHFLAKTVKSGISIFAAGRYLQWILFLSISLTVYV